MLRQSEMVRKESMARYGFGIEAMKAVKICVRCAAVAHRRQQYCRECGAALPEEDLYQIYVKRHRHCAVCKTVVNEKMQYCPSCGQRLEEEL